MELVEDGGLADAAVAGQEEWPADEWDLLAGADEELVERCDLVVAADEHRRGEAGSGGVGVQFVPHVSETITKYLVIVDNAMYSFGYQLDNGIPIVPFYYNKADRELKTLVAYLKSLYHVKDVREINVKSFKLHHFSESGSHDELLRRLFE